MKFLALFVLACFASQAMAGSNTYPPSDNSCVVCSDVYRNRVYPSTLDCDPLGRKKFYIVMDFLNEEWRGACVALDGDDLKYFERVLPSDIASVSIYMDAAFKIFGMRIPRIGPK